MGADLAAKSYPVGMSVRKNSKNLKAETKSTRDLVATLEIAASSADATLIYYQKRLILERLALLIGADMIVDIKVIHNSAIVTAIPQIPVRPLTARQKTCLSPEQLGTDMVGDDELRIALERLGRYIETRSN